MLDRILTRISALLRPARVAPAAEEVYPQWVLDAWADEARTAETTTAALADDDYDYPEEVSP